MQILSINLDQACERALEQIKDRRYDQTLREDGRNEILAYGIAFYKKRCKVVVERLQRDNYLYNDASIISTINWLLFCKKLSDVYVGMGISAIALIWIIWFQYKEKNHLIYMNIVKSRNFVIKFSANP